MNKQTFTFLGRDSGFGKENTSAYVINGNTFLLVDCGYTVFNKVMWELDITKYENIQIIVTHLHNDHAGSLGHLIACLWFNYNKKTTLISKCEHIAEFLDFTGTPREAYNLVDNFKEYDLEFIKTEHTPYVDAYGFKATINNRKIVYTGDTGTIEPYKNYLDGIDEFYIDTSVTGGGGTHLKIEEMLPLLRELKSKGTDIYLMHLQNKDKIREITNNEFFMD